MGVGRNVSASYLHVGGCWEECVSLAPTCGWVLGGMCQPRTYMWVGVGRNVLALYLHVGRFWEESVILVTTCRWVLGGMCQSRTYM